MSAAFSAAGPQAIPALSKWRKLALASGDLGLNLYWQSITYYLLFFYTDIIGLSPVVAGTIYMIASIFDGIMDPIAGYLMDRTQTRWGRYRPWIAIGAVPLAVSFMAIYWLPTFTGAALIVFIAAAHIVFRLFYTVVAVPIASLSASIVRDSRERTSLTGMRIMFALSGAVVVATATRPLASALGQSEATGFFLVAALSGCAATAIYAIVVLSIREPVDSIESAMVRRTKIPARLRVASIMQNRAFLSAIGGLLGATLAVTIVSKSVVYYFKYVVLDEAAGSTALIVITTSSFLSVPMWTLIARRYGQRAMWLMAVAAGLSGLLFMGLIRPTDGMTATAFYVVLQMATAGIAVAYWATLPDTVEYGQWRTGIRLESFLVGLFMFAQKLGLGLAAGLFGWLLGVIGLGHGTVADAEIALKLPIIVVLCAAAGFGLSGICVLMSPLRNGVHDRIVADLLKRSESSSNEREND